MVIAGSILILPAVQICYMEAKVSINNLDTTNFSANCFLLSTNLIFSQLKIGNYEDCNRL